jgi:hypothetical protein
MRFRVRHLFGSVGVHMFSVFCQPTGNIGAADRMSLDGLRLIQFTLRSKAPPGQDASAYDVVRRFHRNTSRLQLHILMRSNFSKSINNSPLYSRQERESNVRLVDEYRMGSNVRHSRENSSFLTSQFTEQRVYYTVW